MATYRGLQKVTTNLTGLNVAKNPHVILNSVYSKTLRALAKMPQDFAYRKHTEQVINERNALVKSISNVQELENKINCGQIEEVIVQAERELYLTRQMLAWKCWEPLMTQPEPNQWKWPL